MHREDEAFDEVERGQQQLRHSIAESARLIGEAQQRMDSSRALTEGEDGQGEPG